MFFFSVFFFVVGLFFIDFALFCFGFRLQFLASFELLSRSSAVWRLTRAINAINEFLSFSFLSLPFPSFRYFHIVLWALLNRWAGKYYILFGFCYKWSICMVYFDRFSSLRSPEFYSAHRFQLISRWDLKQIQLFMRSFHRLGYFVVLY